MTLLQVKHEAYRYRGFQGKAQHSLRSGILYAYIYQKNGLYWLKVGRKEKTFGKIFWTYPGDEVIESYMQACLHMTGIFETQHDTRMSERFALPDGITEAELVGLLNGFYADAVSCDKRTDWKLFQWQARQGKARRGPAWQGAARQAWLGVAWLGLAWHGRRG